MYHFVTVQSFHQQLVSIGNIRSFKQTDKRDDGVSLQLVLDRLFHAFQSSLKNFLDNEADVGGGHTNLATRREMRQRMGKMRELRLSPSQLVSLSHSLTLTNAHSRPFCKLHNLSPFVSLLCLLLDFFAPDFEDKALEQSPSTCGTPDWQHPHLRRRHIAPVLPNTKSLPRPN